MINTFRVSGHQLDLVLPATWVTIPLQPQSVRARDVRILVQRQFRGVDNQPLLRTETEHQLLVSADRAADAGADFLALSLMQVAGVPIPASMVAHSIPLESGDPRESTGCLAVLDRIIESLGDVESQHPAARLARGRVAAGDVLRRVAHRPGHGIEGSDPPTVIVADYWLPWPDDHGTALLCFSTPLTTHQEPMLELFDAIVESVHWTSPGDSEDIDPEEIRDR